MKDNKDEEKTLFQAIDAVDDKFLMETLKDMEKRKNQNHKQQLKFKQMTPMVKAATIALICFLTLGISVSVAAATSKTFRQWIQKTFMRQTIHKVTETKDVSDHKKNQKIVLKDNMEIKQGHNQSFICQYHYEGKYDVEVTDKVYTIEGNHLKELKPEKKWFHGIYNGRKFSFQYAVIRGEIYVYNVKGNISDIFWKVWDEDTIYASLYHMNKKDDIIQKECIAKLNLKTGKVTKITDDTKICNMEMSPDGEWILLNYRSKGYWSALNLKTGKETKQPGISGYAHNEEICFIGKDRIVAMGNPVMTKNSEYNVWNKINLKTAKATKQWDDRSKEEQYSNNEWYVYKEKKGKLHLKHLAYETSIDIPDVKTVHIIDDAGDYVLFDDDQGNDYLCNLRNKTYKKFILPKKFRDDTQMYLAGKEKKMLVQHGKEIYLIDISDMYKNIPPRK